MSSTTEPTCAVQATEDPVARFVRLCLEPVPGDPTACVPFYAMIREYQFFTGHPIPPRHKFKAALARHIRPAYRPFRGPLASRVSDSDFVPSRRLVYLSRERCTGLRLTAYFLD